MHPELEGKFIQLISLRIIWIGVVVSLQNYHNSRRSINLNHNYDHAQARIVRSAPPPIVLSVRNWPPRPTLYPNTICPDPHRYYCSTIRPSPLITSRITIPEVFGGSYIFSVSRQCRDIQLEQNGQYANSSSQRDHGKLHQFETSRPFKKSLFDTLSFL